MKHAGTAIVLFLALHGCAGGGAEPPTQATLLDELADFQSLTVSVDGGPCPPDACGESFRFQSDGSLVHSFRGQRFEGRLPPADLELLSSLANSEAVIGALLKVPGCSPVIHGTQYTEIQIVPGIFAAGDISGCPDGPLASLRYNVHAMAKRLFPDSSTNVGPAAPLPNIGKRFRLYRPVVFVGFSLDRRWGPCPAGTFCAESLGVSPEHGVVSQLGGSPRGEFRGVTDFEPLSTVAVRPDVIAELRKPSPCPAVDDLTETMYLSIAKRMSLRAGTAGCTDGPIAELRAAARALVARLAAAPAPDAGIADHPADLAPP